MKLGLSWRKKIKGQGINLAHSIKLDETEAPETEAPEPKTEPEAEQEKEIQQKEKENIQEVAPATSQTTEDKHGGSEATKDIENSPNSADEGIQKKMPQQAKAPSQKQEEQEQEQEQESQGQEKQYSEKKEYYDATFDLEAHVAKRLATAFSEIISKIAEDFNNEDDAGQDFWCVDALMKRTLDKRSLHSCKKSYKREKVVIILDTSGSCQSQAEFFASIATVALQTGDVVLYNAPNATTYTKNEGKGWVGSRERWWEMKNRKIIFFGDFDGGDAVTVASWQNQVYWFSCEDRYEDMWEHDWCNYTLNDFKGMYLDCNSNQDFIRCSRKIK